MIKFLLSKFLYYKDKIFAFFLSFFVLSCFLIFQVSADEVIRGNLQTVNITVVNISAGTSASRSGNAQSTSYGYLYFSGGFNTAKITATMSNAKVYAGNVTAFQFDYLSNLNSLTSETLEFDQIQFFDQNGNLCDSINSYSVGSAHYSVNGLYAYTIKGSFTPSVAYTVGKMEFTVVNSVGSYVVSNGSCGVAYVSFSNPYYGDEQIINNQNENTNRIINSQKAQTDRFFSNDYNSADFSSANQLHSDEQQIIEDSSSGYSAARNSIVRIGNLLQAGTLSNGLLAITNYINIFFNGVSWLNVLIYFSLALGLVGFIIGMSRLVGRFMR